MTRYAELQVICQRLGVITRPRKLPVESAPGAGVWVVPILSWYHQSFDTECDLVLPRGAKLAKSESSIRRFAASWEYFGLLLQKLV